MKKLVSLLLTMVMVLSLSACSLTSNAPAGGGSAGNDAAGDTGDASTVEEAANAVHFDLSTTGPKGLPAGRCVRSLRRSGAGAVQR